MNERKLCWKLYSQESESATHRMRKKITNHISDKGLLSKYKEFENSIIERQLNKWTKDLSRHFSKENVEVDN